MSSQKVRWLIPSRQNGLAILLGGLLLNVLVGRGGLTGFAFGDVSNYRQKSIVTRE